jgi:CubicO group peptidase (beta-lactamase class C family)
MMNSRITPTAYVSLAAIGVLLSATSNAEPPDAGTAVQTLTDGDKDTFIQLTMRSAGLPGLQTVVVKDGRVVWARSYGSAVLDQPGPRRSMQNDSVMFSASVAKILVTVAALQQVEKGKLSLDDDINQSVPFKVRNPTWPDVPITWRMLLTHTSSLNSEDDELSNASEVYGRDPSTTLDHVVKSMFVAGGSHSWADQFTHSKPGTERIYSNRAFDLMASALQGIVHEPFEQYVEREILKPLGMTQTSYRLAGRPIDRFAVGYASVRQKDGGYEYVPIKAYWSHGAAGGRLLDHQRTCPDFASGCAHTTALDFARLMLMLMSRGTLDGKQILQPSSVDLMTTPIGLRNLDGWAQGLGLAGPKDIRGRQVWGHDGEDRGASNALYFNRDTGVGAIVFSNAMDPEWTLTYVVVDLDLHLMSWFE